MIEFVRLLFYNEVKTQPLTPAYLTKEKSKMLITFTRWFQAPIFPEDEDKTRSALLLNVVLNTFIIALPVIFVGALLGGYIPRLERSQVIVACAWLTIFGTRLIMLAGRVVMAGIVLMTILFTATTLAVYNIGTIRAPATSFYILAIVMAGLTINRRAITWVATLSAVTVIILLLAERRDLLPPPTLTVTITQGITLVVIFAIISILLYLAVQGIDGALARARQELVERQRTEEKLRASEERFRAMIENISDAIALVNAEGIVYYLSPTSERILGYSASERIGLSAFDNILDPSDVSNLKSIFGELQAEPQATKSFTLQARHKDGSQRWLEATATNLLDLDSVQAIVVNYRDVTERIHAEKEREKYIEELGRQNAELEQFTYTVSHDLRNPLVTIKGFLGSVEKDLQDGRQDRIQNDFRRIDGAADKMQALLSELLELSRVGRIINPLEEFDLVKLTQEALESLDARIRSRNVTVKISPDLPWVFGDRIRLREVLENLIDNAAKYAGEQTAPLIEIGVRDQNGSPVIFVRDNGIGIDPKYHTRIFSLFEKLDPTSEGTGIGLALIKRIIEVHGGTTWVESEGSGKGSTFCFTIPNGRK